MRAWAGPVLLTLLVAAGVNGALFELSVAHDVVLVVVLAAATVAATGLALQSLDLLARVPWEASGPDTRPGRGEDTRTATYRRVVQAHLTSREADDTVLWQLADLARRRVRQVHGFRPEDDPARAEALLGPQLAEWVAHDRRHREPGQPQPRYTVAVLDDAVRRIEEL